jgi:hypothetical protein
LNGDDYYENLQIIESLWKKLKTTNFSDQEKSNLLEACQKGRELFSNAIIPECKGKRWSISPEVPAFRRAIMLFEQEENWTNAYELADQAIKIGIPNDWYQKRILKYKKNGDFNQKREL